MVSLTLADMSSSRTGGGAVDACEALHKHVGGSFSLRFKNRSVPIIMRRLEALGRVCFVFQVGYTIDEKTAFPGMRIFVGATQHSLFDNNAPVTQDDAYVAYIRALPSLRWKGSDMIELALGIARAMGARRAGLYDATHFTCAKPRKGKKDDNDVGYDLSLIMLLSRQVTFYGRYGFVPVASNQWQASYLESRDSTVDLCSLLAQLKRVSASSFKTYLRAMLRHLDRKPKPATGLRLVNHNVEFGVLQIRVLSVANGVASFPARVTLMKRLLAAFLPHDGLLLPLFDDGDGNGTAKTLSCSAKADMLELFNMSYPILRLGPARKPTTTVQWVPWGTISRISRIRGLDMQAVVHEDPAKQRRKTFCPPRPPST